MYYVMSDIHGCYDELTTALNHWNRETEHLIILGDLIDRGPDSLQVVRHLMLLKKLHPDKVTVIKGNHDQMFTSWLMDTPFEMLAYYYNPEHNETLRSFYDDNKRYQKASKRQRAEHIIYHFKEELSFLNELPYYFESDHLLFVHAGINLKINDWREDKKEILWSRTFPYSNQELPKKTFFGHTPTPYLHEIDDQFDVWTNDTNDRVGIDGAVAFNGQLNALKVNSVGDIVDIIVVPANNQKENE